MKKSGSTVTCSLGRPFNHHALCTPSAPAPRRDSGSGQGAPKRASAPSVRPQHLAPVVPLRVRRLRRERRHARVVLHPNRRHARRLAPALHCVALHPRAPLGHLAAQLQAIVALCGCAGRQRLPLGGVGRRPRILQRLAFRAQLFARLGPAPALVLSHTWEPSGNVFKHSCASHIASASSCAGLHVAAAGLSQSLTACDASAVTCRLSMPCPHCR